MASPTGPEFGIVVCLEPTGTVVKVVGEVDVDTAPELRRTTTEVINAGETCLIVDMAEMTFIDSYGLGILVGAHRRIGEQGGSVVLRSVTPRTRNVLEMTGLDKVFTIDDHRIT